MSFKSTDNFNIDNQDAEEINSHQVTESLSCHEEEVCDADIVDDITIVEVEILPIPPYDEAPKRQWERPCWVTPLPLNHTIH